MSCHFSSSASSSSCHTLLFHRLSRSYTTSAFRSLSTSIDRRGGGDGKHYPPPNLFNPKSDLMDTQQSSSFSTFGASPDLLSHYLKLQPAPLTLRQLLVQGGQVGQLPTSQQLIASAQHTQRELPIRLATRVGGFRALPFIVGSNPFVSKIARLYASGFEAIARFGPIQTLEDNVKFTSCLEELVSAHGQNIPTLARGFQESKRYMDAQQISAFLNAAIHSRIAIRMIAEQHLAISSVSHALSDVAPPPPQLHNMYGSPTAVGIIETQLNPARMIRMCATFVRDLCEATLGSAPELVLEGDLAVTYTGVPVHLEYIMTELLKNSYRATTENHLRRGATTMPPVIVTIAQSNKHITLRIRDQGGGIAPQNMPHVFSYAFTTASSSDSDSNDSSQDPGPYEMQAVGGNGDGLTEMGKFGLNSGLGTLAGLGYGLPMAKIYAEYFKEGATLDLVSLYGHGCDTFIKIPRHIELSNTVI